jgi:hypothetical protein
MHREDYDVLLSVLLDSLERDGKLQCDLSRKLEVSWGSDFQQAEDLTGLLDRIGQGSLVASLVNPCLGELGSA